MRIHCKCGNCLTKSLKKVHHTEGTYKEVEKIEYVKWPDGEESEFDSSEWAVKHGTYHKWKRKDWWYGKKNVYVVSVDDFVGAEIYEESKGCCRFDHYEVRCLGCGENIGYGANDCWTGSYTYLYCVKVRILNE